VRPFPRNESGLTLIEVLIALAILSIALTAIVKSASQNIRSTLYLQNRTIATWVGTNIMNSIRVGVIKPQNDLTEDDQTLGQNWQWKATVNPTPNPRIKKIIVDVYHQPENNKLAHLESYLYAG
jgi:general secretion pathway protein I